MRAKKKNVTLTKSEELTEQKIEDNTKALKSAHKEEPPEEQIRILKLLVKDAKTRIHAAGADENEDELVADWEKAEFPYKHRMSNKRYEKEKLPLQVELLKLQKWVKETGKKIVIIFEGRDAAGSPSAWQGTGVDARGLPEEVSQVGELLFKRGDLGGCGAFLRAKYRGSTRGAEEGIIDIAEDGEVGTPEAFE